MDFTFFAAFFIAIMTGFVGACFLALSGQRLTRSHFRTMVAWTVPASFLISVNWSRVTLAESWMLVVSLMFITLYGAMGVAIGMAPVVAVAGVIRRVSRQTARASDDSA